MIRDARSEDFVRIAAITNHYIETTSIHFGYEPVSPDHLRAQWDAGRERYPYLVAVDDQAGVVGYAKAGTWRERDAYRWTTEIGLYVDAGQHRRGVGRALYQELLRELSSRGFRSAIAGITLPNDPSRAFHLAFGFASVGTVRDAGYKRGNWHDVEFFQHRFAGDPG
ncbi:MAG: N-acetyltransferase [Deltaproteobacteria bacterium]|nr:N-acetyltransferase [Deltaproteobacteria bacterium]